MIQGVSHFIAEDAILKAVISYSLIVDTIHQFDISVRCYACQFATANFRWINRTLSRLLSCLWLNLCDFEGFYNSVDFKIVDIIWDTSNSFLKYSSAPDKQGVCNKGGV